jgi:glycosyltransferase involved in cell wall biosynthesis
MKNNPLVSIITPFFNAEAFFQEAIESVLAQTYCEWELLLVDDGSTDGSTTIAINYAQKYPDKIYYLEHENHQNRGKSTSRNLGIDRAKGQYIALLDADDIYLPEKLAKQVEILESQPETAMVYGATQYWYSWTGNSPDLSRDFLARLGVSPNTLFEPPTLFAHFLKDAGIVPCTCGLLVRHSTVKAIDRFDESIQHLYEDQVFLAKICLEYPVFVEAGCWDKYRQHLNSSWQISLQTGAEYAARFLFLEWLERYLPERRITHPEIWRSLKQLLLAYRHPIIYKLTQFPQYFAKQMKRVSSAIVRAIVPASIRRWLRTFYNQKKMEVSQ